MLLISSIIFLWLVDWCKLPFWPKWPSKELLRVYRVETCLNGTIGRRVYNKIRSKNHQTNGPNLPLFPLCQQSLLPSVASFPFNLPFRLVFTFPAELPPGKLWIYNDVPWNQNKERHIERLKRTHKSLEHLSCWL